nr:hypothetical protein [Tanacetum cinerariifolium]
VMHEECSERVTYTLSCLKKAKLTPKARWHFRWTAKPYDFLMSCMLDSYNIKIDMFGFLDSVECEP